MIKEVFNCNSVNKSKVSTTLVTFYLVGGGGLSDSEAWRDVTPVVQCVPDPLELLALVGVWQGDDIFPLLLLLCRAARAASSPVDWNQTFTYLTSICTSVLIHW